MIFETTRRYPRPRMASTAKYKLPWISGAVSPKAYEQVSHQEGLSSASEPGQEVRLSSFGDEVSMLTVRASRHPSSTAPSCRSVSGYRVLPPIRGGSHSPSEQSWSGVDEPLAERSLHLNLGQLDLMDQDLELTDRKEMNSLRYRRAKLSLSSLDSDLDSSDSAVMLERLTDSPSVMLNESGFSRLYSPPNYTLSGTKASRLGVAKHGEVTCQPPTDPLASIYGQDFPGSLHGSCESPENKTMVRKDTAESFPTPPSSQGPATPPQVFQPPHQPRPPCRPRQKKASGTRQRRAVACIRTQPSLSDGSGDEVSMLTVRASRHPSSTAPSCRSVSGYRVLPPIRGGSHSPSEKSWSGVDEPLAERSLHLNLGQLDLMDQDLELTDRKEMNSLRYRRAKLSLSSLDSDLDSSDSAVMLERLTDSPSVPLNESGFSRLYSPPNYTLSGTKASRLGVAKHGEVTCQPPTDPLASIYGQDFPGSLHGSCESPENKTMVRKDTAESFPTPPSSQGPATPPQVFQPPHQPRPPCRPRQKKASGTRQRRAVACIRTQPSPSDGSDKLSPEKGQKEDAQEQPDLGPIVRPELALTNSLELLSSDNWEKKIDGLTTIRCLAHYHSGVLQTRLHDVCIALTQEVKDLHSSVSRVALVTVRDLCVLLKRMGLELEALAKVVLVRAGDSSAFIRREVDAALDSMVQHGSPTLVIKALINGGLSHLNPAVRNCTAQHLADLVEKVGVGRLLSGPKEITNRILPAIAKLAQDSSKDARNFGRHMLLSLASCQDFKKMAEKYLPAKDLVTILAITAKGLGKLDRDAPLARGQPSLPDHAPVRASTLAREPVCQTNRDPREFAGRGQVYSMAEKADSIRQMKALMASKDFRERLKGIDQLVAVCESNPRAVIASLLQVFDPIRDCLLESNSKVNLHALEALQKIIPLLKDNMTLVLCFLVPAIVDTHLNSKRDAVYNAAVGAVHALMQNIDNTHLIQPFCFKARFLKGKAKVDLTEKVADLVTELHTHKPQTVEKNALPLLWDLLDPSCRSGTMQGATAALCKALYSQMGPALAERASKKSISVRKGLDKLLKTLPSP